MAMSSARLVRPSMLWSVIGLYFLTPFALNDGDHPGGFPSGSSTTVECLAQFGQKQVAYVLAQTGAHLEKPLNRAGQVQVDVRAGLLNLHALREFQGKGLSVCTLVGVMFA
jgi:hypothetical protein